MATRAIFGGQPCEYTMPAALGATGRILASGASAADWSTFALPTTGGVAGQFIQSDGTDGAWSAYKHPTTVGGANSFLQSNGTDYVASAYDLPVAVGGANSFLQSNGTDYAASAYDLPAAAGAANTFLQSDGTDYAASAYAMPAAVGNNGDILRVAAGVPAFIDALKNDAVGDSITFTESGGTGAFTATAFKAQTVLLADGTRVVHMQFPKTPSSANLSTTTAADLVGTLPAGYAAAAVRTPAGMTVVSQAGTAFPCSIDVNGTTITIRTTLAYAAAAADISDTSITYIAA